MRVVARPARPVGRNAFRPGRARVPAIIAAVLAVVLYLPSLSYDFARDDHDLISRNAALQGGAPLSQLLLSDFTAASSGQSGKWRPVVTLANWLDGRIGTGSRRLSIAPTSSCS